MIATAMTISPEQFLDDERARPREAGKVELLFGTLYEMAGTSRIHSKIASNLHFEIRKVVSDDFSVNFGDLRVVNPLRNSYVYPDLVIYREPGEFSDQHFDTLLNPISVIEILSPGTEAKDRSLKFQFYRSIPSLQEYILVGQEKPLIEVYRRKAENHWEVFIFDQLTDQIPLTQPSMTLNLEAVYAKVKWDPSGAEDEQ